MKNEKVKNRSRLQVPSYNEYKPMEPETWNLEQNYNS